MLRRPAIVPSLLLLLLTGCQPPPTVPVANQPVSHSEPSNSASYREGRSEQRDDSEGSEEPRRHHRRHEDGGGSDYQPRSSGHGGTSAAPGQFDYYLFTLSWSPEFCYSHPDKPECASRAGFVVHGLWPENADGTYPEHCSDVPLPADAGSYTDVYPDAGLLAHEWTTHGTCSGLPPAQYFAAIRKLAQTVHPPPALSSVTNQMSLTPDAIVGAFVRANLGTAEEDYSLGCGNNFLSQIEVCVDKNLHAVACQGLHSCRANVVKVTPPGATRGQ